MCAGVAEYFNVDPVIVRIAAVVLLFSGPGAFAYVLAWIFVPEAPGPVPHGAPQAPIDRRDRATQVFGIVLIALAVSVFWGDWWSPARHWLLPLGLMALGAWLLLRRDDRGEADGELGDGEGLTASPPAAPSPTPGAWGWGAAPNAGSTTAAPPDPDAPAVTDDVDPTVEAPLADEPPGDGAGGGEPPTAPWAAGDVPRIPEPPAVAPRSRRRRMLGPIVFGALLVWTGVAFLAGLALQTGLAGGLLILGFGFVLGAFVGGSRALILPALVVAGALLVTGLIDIPLSGPVGRQHWVPADLADLEDSYEVSIGEAELDLRSVVIPAGERVPVTMSVGVGHLVVLVPRDAAIEVTTDVGAGEAVVLGETREGVGVTADQFAPGGTRSGTLVLDLQVGMGQIEVRRSTDVVTTLG